MPAADVGRLKKEANSRLEFGQWAIRCGMMPTVVGISLRANIATLCFSFDITPAGAGMSLRRNIAALCFSFDVTPARAGVSLH